MVSAYQQNDKRQIKTTDTSQNLKKIQNWDDRGNSGETVQNTDKQLSSKPKIKEQN